MPSLFDFCIYTAHIMMILLICYRCITKCSLVQVQILIKAVHCPLPPTQTYILHSKYVEIRKQNEKKKKTKVNNPYWHQVGTSIVSISSTYNLPQIQYNIELQPYLNYLLFLVYFEIGQLKRQQKRQTIQSMVLQQEL